MIDNYNSLNIQIGNIVSKMKYLSTNGLINTVKVGLETLNNLGLIVAFLNRTAKFYYRMTCQDYFPKL